MKKSLFSITVFILAFTALIWAQNNVLDNVENIKAKWGNIKSEDKNVAGELHTHGYIDVDIDYPGEKWWNKKYGIDYEAYGKAKAGFQWGTWGTYSIRCAVPNDIEPAADRYSVWASRYERAKYFDRKRGNDADALSDYNEADVRRHLRRCSSSATISRFRNPNNNQQSNNQQSSTDSYYGEWYSSMSVG